MKHSRILATVVLFFITLAPVHAALNLEITGGVNSGRKIAVIPFANQQGLPTDIASVINSDLARSGKFSPADVSTIASRPHHKDEVHATDFDGSTEAVVVGRISRADNKTLVINFELVQLVSGQSRALSGYQAKVPVNKIRQYAHRISDLVFEKLTGIKGAFNTRIAYIKTRFGNKHPYELVVADYDGNNEVRLVISSQPLMSPSWSPDGKKLAYVSFQNRRAEIYTIDIATRKTTKITSFAGLNSTPKWSPDGSKLAFVLSKDGNPEIYYSSLANKTLTRVTKNSAIDTEPAWSPDGKSIYFVSERGGNAQVYNVQLAGGTVTKVSHMAKKNLSPAPMPDGSGLVMINQSEGFKVAKQDYSGQVKLLTDTTLDESPSVSPNSTMIIYSTVYGGRKGLAIVSSDGRFKANLPNTTGEISSPAWSPFLTK